MCDSKTNLILFCQINPSRWLSSAPIPFILATSWADLNTKTTDYKMRLYLFALFYHIGYDLSIVFIFTLTPSYAFRDLSYSSMGQYDLSGLSYRIIDNFGNTIVPYGEVTLRNGGRSLIQTIDIDTRGDYSQEFVPKIATVNNEHILLTGSWNTPDAPLTTNQVLFIAIPKQDKITQIDIQYSCAKQHNEPTVSYLYQIAHKNYDGPSFPNYYGHQLVKSTQEFETYFASNHFFFAKQTENSEIHLGVYTPDDVGDTTGSYPSTYVVFIRIPRTDNMPENYKVIW